MSRRALRFTVWSLWLLSVASFVVGGPLLSSAEEDGVASSVAYSVFVLAFATMGALVASRRPRNPIGWILLAAGVAYAIGGFSVLYAEEMLAGTRDAGFVETALAWVSTWVWMAGIGPVATFGLLLFPNGRLPSRRWRVVAWLAAGGVALMLVGIALAPGRFEDLPIENPLGLDAAPAVPDALAEAGGLALIVGVVGSIASLFARFRTARSQERDQLKWLTYAAGVVGLGLSSAIVIEIAAGPEAVDLTNAIVSLSLAAVPVAIGIAILRHRLFDIDVVINRTLVYGGLTATLAGAYLGCVLLFQLALSPLTEESSLAIAGSTLAVAALFRPARARIQAAVDRRFYRRRYDAARTLEAFGGRLRDELDLEALGADLQGVVRDTVQPAHVSLWLRRVS
jgi:hypothetical protein